MSRPKNCWKQASPSCKRWQCLLRFPCIKAIRPVSNTWLLFIPIRKRVPPKSLLDMVDDRERLNSMTLMKSLTSLDSAARTPSDPCARAKMASGVSVLMEAQADVNWLRPFGPSVLIRPKAQRPKTVKMRLRLFVRSIVRRLPQNKGNQLALAYGMFVIIYAVCKLFFEVYLLFATPTKFFLEY